MENVFFRQTSVLPLPDEIVYSSPSSKLFYFMTKLTENDEKR